MYAAANRMTASRLRDSICPKATPCARPASTPARWPSKSPMDEMAEKLETRSHRIPDPQ
jgi:hypothetical protein